MTDEQRPITPGERRQHVSARVPESIGAGVFASATVVMATGQELVLDFLQTLVQPHQVVARVIVPWPTVPQLSAALRANLEKYDSRFGRSTAAAEDNEPDKNPAESIFADEEPTEQNAGKEVVAEENAIEEVETKEIPVEESSDLPAERQRQPDTGGVAVPARKTGDGNPVARSSGAGDQPIGTRQVPARSFYEDLRLDDEILKGHYSNGAMINHTQFEFKIDFLTTLAPHPIVTARIFLSEPQMRRLLLSIEENEKRRRGA